SERPGPRATTCFPRIPNDEVRLLHRVDLGGNEEPRRVQGAAQRLDLAVEVGMPPVSTRVHDLHGLSRGLDLPEEAGPFRGERGTGALDPLDAVESLDARETRQVLQGTGAVEVVDGPVH